MHPLLAALALAGPLAAASPEPTKLDRHGDPLPPGAVQRFGRVLFGQSMDQCVPSADGRSILCLGHDIHLLKFDRQTGKLAGQTDLPAEPCYWAMMPRDGRRVLLCYEAYSSTSHKWEVWHLERRVRVSTIRLSAEQASMLPAISADGRFVAATATGTSGSDGELRTWAWDANTGRQLWQTAANPGGGSGSSWLTSPVFSSDGRRVLVTRGAGRQGFYFGLDTAGGRLVWQTARADGRSYPLQIPNGQLLLDDEPGGRLLAWADGEASDIRLPPDLKREHGLGFADNGSVFLYMVARDDKRELRAWNTKLEKADPRFRPFQLPANTHPQLWDDGPVPVVMLSGRVNRLLDLKTQRVVGPSDADAGHGGAVKVLAFSPDGAWLTAEARDALDRR